jgi:hypothetical protein
MASAVVTILPSPEMKEPVCVRSNFPDRSKTVTQITEGRTLLSNLTKSRDGLCLGFVSGGLSTDGDKLGS